MMNFVKNDIRGIPWGPKLDQKIDQRSSFHWLAQLSFHWQGQLEFGHPVIEMPTTLGRREILSLLPLFEPRTFDLPKPN